MLNTNYTEDEVLVPVHQLEKWKVLGPYDLASDFFIDNWDLVKTIVYDTILGMLTNQISIE